MGIDRVWALASSPNHLQTLDADQRLSPPRSCRYTHPKLNVASHQRVKAAAPKMLSDASQNHFPLSI